MSASIRSAMVELIPFAMVATCIAAFWRSPGVMFVLLAAVAGLMLRRRHALPDLLYFILPASLGTAAELVATASGAWSYGQSSLLVPLWVPLAWGSGALAMMRTIEAILAAAEQMRQAREVRQTPAASVSSA